ncbi:MAG: T9SS type A sorting domain-containing protein, partial [Flavobacteriia bacterium]|nr:T9SS type A sorting domain-containing protein [Flavobacteriia bacterium]
EINYTYNSFGNPLFWNEEEWDGSQWVPTANYYYTYDVNGFPTDAEVREWDAATSAFIPVQKYTEVQWYNWVGNIDDGLVAYTLNLGYNTTTSAWDTVGQTTYTYGVNNSLVMLEEEFVNGNFINSFRHTEDIDYQGRATFMSDESWNTSSNAWDINWEEANNYTYDVNDNLTQRINQYWDQTSMILVNSIRNDYTDFQTFDNTTGLFSNEAGTLSVYPNPMHESVTISTDHLTENVTMIQLVDLNGTVVKTIDNINGTTTEISRDALKSGLYFVQVKSGSTVLAMTKLLVD